MTKSSWSPDAGSEPRGGATQWSGFHPHRVEQRNGVCDDEAVGSLPSGNPSVVGRTICDNHQKSTPLGVLFRGKLHRFRCFICKDYDIL